MKGVQVLLLVIGLGAVSIGTPQARAEPFDQGRFRLSLAGGTVRNFDNQYLAIGLGAGYFLFDGWELGVEAETWLGGNPSVSKLSPFTRFIFYMVPVVHPYLGMFYKHWFIGSDYQDVDTLGGQVGLVLVVGRNLLVGGGIAHEVILSECDEDCSDTYPELHFSITF